MKAVCDVKDTIFWIENRRSQSKSQRRESRMWNADSFLSWKLMGQSGRDFKWHSDFVCFYWGRHSEWHPQYNTSIKSNYLKLN